jgi:hypothetical protein
VLGEIGGINRLHKGSVEQAGFAVLKAPDIPSILIETAFISNPEEEAKLLDEAYQNKLADAIVTGIRATSQRTHRWQEPAYLQRGTMASTANDDEYGALPAVQITAADGAKSPCRCLARTCCRGKPPTARSACSSGANAAGRQQGDAGGVPVIFPQFNVRGPGLRHGFARVSNWRLTGQGGDGGSSY